MTAETFLLRPPRLAFAICGWRWQNDVHEIKYSVCVCFLNFPGYYGKGKVNAKTQKQSTILYLRMQLENICLCKGLKSQNKTEFVFISGSR